MAAYSEGGRRVRQGSNFSPTPGFAQVWCIGVRKWLLSAHFRAITELGDDLRSMRNQDVDAREYGDYSVILNANPRRVEASVASGVL
jgi:hypothetical protein